MVHFDINTIRVTDGARTAFLLITSDNSPVAQDRAALHIPHI
jgi:hypothetical protein